MKAGSNHPLEFRRGKLVLPASMLGFGEHPSEGAENLEPKFLEMQSHLGAHWDLCLVYEGKVKSRASFESETFYDKKSLPRKEIAADHLELIDSLKMH